MKKLSLGVIGLYLGILSSFSQTTGSDTGYKSKALTIDEINFVSGYYHQDGNNSAVTGGIGTEKLTDFANTLDLKLSRYSNDYIKHSLALELGIDHYTSASSDKIDPRTISSASMSDTRIYPSATYTRTNEKNGITLGANASFSKEFDYTSLGAGFSFTKSSKDHNEEFTAKTQAYFDTWKVIYPYGVKIPGNNQDQDKGMAGSAPRNSYSLSLSYAQVVSPNLQMMLLFEPNYQKGLLATKYQRVYFTDGSLQSENLPGTRLKIPLGLRVNYFAGDRFLIRTFLRYYQDDWGIKAYTGELELPVKVTSFFSISPFYRYYSQDAIKYFAPYGQHAPGQTYFTSDYDLSKFHSQYFGLNIRTAPPGGVFNIQAIKSVELRFGHYIRSTGLHSNQLTLAIGIL